MGGTAAIPPPPAADDVTPSLGPVSTGSGSKMDLFRGIINHLSGGGTPAIQERLAADYALRQQNAQNALNQARQATQYKTHATNSVTGAAPFGINPVTGQPATAQDHQKWDNDIAQGTQGYLKALPKDAKPIAQKLFEVAHHVSGHKPPEGGAAAALPPPPQSVTAGPALPPPPSASASQNPMEIPSVANPAVMAAPELSRMAAMQHELAQKRAELAQQMHGSQTIFNPEGTMSQQAISGTGEPIGTPIQNVMPAKLFSPAMYHPVSVVGPDGVTPIPGMQNKFTKEISDQEGNIIPNAKLFSGSLVQKTTNRDVTSPGGLTTHTRSTVGPAGKTGAGGAGGSAKAGGGRPAAILPPAVAAAQDRIMMGGVPATGKLDDATSLAMQNMKKQGIDPQLMATTGSRTQAEVAGMIEPLIARARQLIAADPKALGPLAGRWSELQQKAGNLEGTPKELAGTLTSIYSLAVKMHGWRGSKVADAFRQQYGDLSNTPASLMSGLDAMQGTTHAIRSTVYPGQNSPATAALPVPASGKKQAYKVDGKWYDAATHQEIH